MIVHVFRVMLCCNDERGNITDRVEGIEIGDEMRLAGSPRTLRLANDRIRIGRHWYAKRGWHTWVGNVFWDSTHMAREVARTLVRDLLAAGWQIEEHAEEGPFADLVGEKERKAAERTPKRSPRR